MSQFKPTLILLISVGMLISSSLFAAVDRATLKVAGKAITGFGPSACTKQEDVEIVLPDKPLQDGHIEFQARFSEVTKKQDANAKGETLCDPSVTDTGNLKKLSKGSTNLPIRDFMPDAACGKESGASGERVLCIYANHGKELVSYARFGFSTTFAKVEDITDISAANGELSFTIKHSQGGASGGSFEYLTCFGKTSDNNIDEADCPDKFFTKSSTTPNVVITGLENDTEYGFKVKIVQGAEPSPWSSSRKVKVERVATPLIAYDGKGGDIQFSCQQSNASSTWMFLFLLIGLFLLRSRDDLLRRGKIVLSTTISGKQHLNILVIGGIFSLGLLFSNSGYSDPGQVNVGLLGSMYRPDLDSEVAASGNKIFPFYKCFFRKKTSEQNGPINPLLGAEFDVHLWDKFGSLQLGLGLGYTFTRGHDLKYNAAGQTDCDSPNENSKISLHMYQLRPQLTYMFNPFADVVPIIPYVRAGLIGHGYMFFRGSKSEKSHTTAEGVLVKPNGFRFGYTLAVGTMLMLDFLEPSAVKSARGQGFLEHVYLKAELSYTKIDTFGRRGFQFSAKDVMGTSWPLLWTFGLVFELP